MKWRLRYEEAMMADIEQQRALISGRIWQSLAQSGVELSAIPREQLAALVAAITEGVLAGVDAGLEPLTLDASSVLGSSGEAPAANEVEETILWSGRPFLSVIDYIEITDQRIRIKHGLFNVSHENIDLARIKDVDYKQNAAERMVDIGDITITSADATEPVAVLKNVPQPEQVHDIIRRAAIEARQRQRVQVREEM
jgi:hypothetical protein